LDSPSHSIAQNLIQELSWRLLETALDNLHNREAKPATAIIQQIPERANLGAEIEDFLHLARARQRAQLGEIADLEAAILQVQELSATRPLYGEGQQLVNRFQAEVKDLSRLRWARQLAAPGTSGDLVVAISEAQRIPPGNPLWEEANAEITTWTQRLQAMEDQPFLDQARLIAASGDVTSLQLAIEQAQNIQQGRELYQEAQTDIRFWREKLQGWQYLQDAYQVVGSGTLAAVTSAIDLAARVDSASPYWAEADRMINVWSQDLLQFAEQQAEYDLAAAITIAQKIPPRSSYHTAAQQLIQTWDSLLNQSSQL